MGYSDYVSKHNMFERINKLVSFARKNDYLVIFVKVGFSKNYVELPKKSPLFAKASEFQALQLGTWATEFHEDLKVNDDDIIITKHRVNSFYATQLETILRANNVTDILVSGVATDIAVASVTRDGHDRDYSMTIVEDCCAAANDDDQKYAITLLQKVAQINVSTELID